jgi:hypothetical protein
MRSRLLAFLASFCGGCTATVPDFGIDLRHPFVIDTEPLDGSIAVNRSSSLRAVFSERIDESSVTTDSVQLLLAGVPIPGTIVTTATAATFTPTERLEDLTPYEFRIEQGIRDLAGLEMQEPFSTSMTTEDLDWEQPFEISASALGGILDGQAAISPDGSVLIVWAEDDDVLRSRRILNGIPQQTIQIDTGLNLNGVQVGFAADGSALATWTKSTGSRADLFYSTWNPSSQVWSIPGLVETDDMGTVGSPDLAVNRAGFAVAVWNQTDSLSFPFRFNAFARSYSPGSGWGTLIPLESRTETAQPPYVAVSEDGDAIVNWSQSDSSSTRLWASHFDILNGWTTAAIIETSGTVEFAQPHIDDDGRAVVVWAAFNRYVPGTGWGAPTALPAFGTAALARDGAGLVAWHEENGGNREVRVSSIGIDGSLEPATLLASSSDAPIYSGGCTIDDSGRRLAIWVPEIDARPSLVAARAGSSGEWSAPLLLENDDLGSVTAVRSVVVSEGGEVAVLYVRYDGVLSRLWVALLR